MNMQPVDLGPLREPREDHVAPCSIRDPRVEPELRIARFSSDVARVFSAELLCWVVPEPVVVLEPRKPRFDPKVDNSGVFWDLRGLDGQFYTRIEAATFPQALKCKREVCRVLGGKSGWARLEKVEEL